MLCLIVRTIPVFLLAITLIISDTTFLLPTLLPIVSVITSIVASILASSICRNEIAAGKYNWFFRRPGRRKYEAANQPENVGARSFCMH
jgi:hypothetical protein